MSKTILSNLIVLPVAAAIGGFAGWAAGSAAGEWLETLGAAAMMDWGGRIGGLLGAVSCPAYIAYKVSKDERNMAMTQIERRETRTS